MTEPVNTGDTLTADAATPLTADATPPVSTGAPGGMKVHPLEPLSAEEITWAASVLRRDKGLAESVRFSTVELHEPPKAAVLDWPLSAPLAREAFVILLDRADGACYEAVVVLDGEGSVGSYRHLPGVQPRIMAEEFVECEQMLKGDPDYLAVLAKRGITDPDLVMVDPWSAGSFDGSDVRLARALSWVRSRPGDNGYARPVEGLVALVDLNTMEVIRLEDHGVTPLPPEDGTTGRTWATCARTSNPSRSPNPRG